MISIFYKHMKTKVFIFSLLLLTVTAASAQSRSDRLYDVFKNKPGVTYFAITKDLQDAFNIELKDEGKNINGDIHEIRLMSYNPEKGTLKGNEFSKKTADMLSSVCKHLDSTDQDDDAEIWMMGNKRKASEFHILVPGEDEDSRCFLISFYGDFDITDAEGIKHMGAKLSLDF